MCGGSPRSELKKMKLYGPSRSTVGIEPHCQCTCFYTQRKDCTQKREKWLLKRSVRLGYPVGRGWRLPLPRSHPLVHSLRTMLHPTLRPCPRLLDHLIRPEKERWGDGEAERLGGLEVDDQLELCGLLHGQVGGRSAF